MSEKIDNLINKFRSGCSFGEIIDYLIFNGHQDSYAEVLRNFGGELVEDLDFKNVSKVFLKYPENRGKIHLLLRIMDRKFARDYLDFIKKLASFYLETMAEVRSYTFRQLGDFQSFYFNLAFEISSERSQEDCFLFSSVGLTLNQVRELDFLHRDAYTYSRSTLLLFSQGLVRLGEMPSVEYFAESSGFSDVKDWQNLLNLFLYTE